MSNDDGIPEQFSRTCMLAKDQVVRRFSAPVPLAHSAIEQGFTGCGKTRLGERFESGNDLGRAVSI